MHLFTCHLLYNGLFSSFSQFASLTVTSSLTCFLSEVHSLHANGAPHHHHHHHVYLIKNQLKTPRRLVSRAEARLRLEQKRFPHSLPLSLTLTISSSLFLPRSPSLSPTPLAPPSCLLEVGNMIYENGELNFYIFFLLHPLIYLLDFFFLPAASSCLWCGGEAEDRERIGLDGEWSRGRPADWQACRHGTDLSHT